MVRTRQTEIYARIPHGHGSDFPGLVGCNRSFFQDRRFVR